MQPTPQLLKIKSAKTLGKESIKKEFFSDAKRNLAFEIEHTSLSAFLEQRKDFAKKKIALVIPNIVGDKIAPTAPLPGVAYVAGFVRTAGHEVSVFDMRVWNSLSKLFSHLDSTNPEFIGISFMTQHEFDKIEAFVTALHERYPSAKLIIGGAGASGLFEKVLNETFVDFAVTREGEYTLVELLDGLKPLSDVSGLIWKKNGEIVRNPFRKFEYNIDELPFPAYDLFPIEKYVDRKIPVVTSRGCPYKCTFCANKASMGVAWRPRSPENVVKEISYWYQKGFTQFHFVDDNFTLDMRRAEKICDLIIQSGMKIRWDLRNGIRVDRISEGLLQKMKDAGCFYFALGIEHIDQEVLDRMKKDLTTADIEKGVAMCEKAGIPFGGFFIVGLLGDTLEKFKKCYAFAQAHSFSEVRFYNPMPFPGTELYEELVERNLLLISPSDYLNNNSKFKDGPVFETPEFPYADRKQALQLGQELVMDKFLKKEFGSVLGTLALKVWMQKSIRSFAMPIGIGIWKQLRRFKRRASVGFPTF